VEEISQSAEGQYLITGEDVSFARAYLDSTAHESYYEGINLGTVESLYTTRLKLSPLVLYTNNPRTVLSVGVGSGEELQALIDLFNKRAVSICGLDISKKALEFARERLKRLGLSTVLIEASAIDMPFFDETIDGIVMSAILHEIYSYVPSGRDAWKNAIHQVARKLSENGVFLMRDFAAPSHNGLVKLTAHTGVARRFYTYFRHYYRTFYTWEKGIVLDMADKRRPNARNFPCLHEKSGTVELPFGKAAEVLLHFRNFLQDRCRIEADMEDPGWKEINETYLPPNPCDLNVETTMPPDVYMSTIVSEANEALADTPYKFICIQQALSQRLDTAALLKRHYSLDDNKLLNEQLLVDMTSKMEFVFMKVQKDRAE
jgi:ubiquinone/menaquinone biosynthesis C-methylase UbiE